MGIDPKWLRSQFDTKQNAQAATNAFVTQAIKEQQNELKGEQSEDVIKFFDYGLRSYTSEAVDIIYKHSGSPIEKIFLGTLLLSFIRSDPLSVRFTPPFRDAPKMIAAWRTNHEHCMSWWKLYRESNNDSVKDFEQWLSNQEITKGRPMSFKQDLVSHIMLHELGFFRHYHFTVQAGFPDIRVNDRAIRTDILVWIPENPNCQIVVECDGYEYHKDKEQFTSDRKRDRALKRHGYDVLRYSGSEIYREPIEMSYDLFDALYDRFPKDTVINY